MKVGKYPGSLHKRGKFYHYVLHLGTDARGREIQFWRSTKKKTRHEAEKEVPRLYQLAQLQLARPGKSQRLSEAIVSEVRRVETDISKEQGRRVESALLEFLRWAGDMKLEKITTPVLENYQRGRLETRAKSTVEKDIFAITRLLVKNGYKVDRPGPARGRENPGRPLTPDECRRFFAGLKTTVSPSNSIETLKTLYFVAFATTSRPGDLVPSEKSTHTALLKREVDLEGGVLTVRRSKKKPGARIRRPKRFKIGPNLLERVVEVANSHDGPTVFPRIYKLDREFRHTLRVAGILQFNEFGEKLTAHCFKHSSITLMAEEGLGATAIASLAGHTDPKMSQHYTDVAESPNVIDIAQIIGETRLQKSLAESSEPGKESAEVEKESPQATDIQ